jgi:hypothetical protein
MMSETGEERIYGLIEIAERQQKVTQIALEGMVNERVALEEELRRLSEGATGLQEDIRSLVSKAIQETRTGAEHAGVAVAEGAMSSLQTAMDNLSKQAEEVEVALDTALRWLSWRFLVMGLSGVAALAALWWLASCAVLWWDVSAIGKAQVRKIQLETEIARLEANRDAWENAGMSATLSRCGPRKRPCVKVDESAGAFGRQGDYRIIGSD